MANSQKNKLNQEEIRILDIFQKAVTGLLGNNLVETRLFGSKARGTAREDSDIDILIVVKSEDWPICDKVYEIASDLLIEHGVSISPKLVSLADLDYGREIGVPFLKNVFKEGVAL